MNKITHKKLIIDFDIWEPTEKVVIDEIMELVNQVKQKKLLAHAGYVHITENEL